MPAMIDVAMHHDDVRPLRRFVARILRLVPRRFATAAPTNKLDNGRTPGTVR
jgi:hypothetical protein